ncbi:MAG: methyltransferase [Acidobacteriota bacterium]
MMKCETPLPMSSIGGEVEYSDNAEDQIFEILSRVDDLSDGSDELAAQIDDWPTRYHCSPQRSNILRPFKIGPGLRVLEIGAGTGALTRYLGEQGAVVTAVEGTRARARSVAERCRGMESVEVVCGDFKNLEPTQAFDVVLVVGVLEYAASGAGGRSTPSSFLDQVAAHLKPEGIVILAIENQLGLKYLLGGKEDHLGHPWVGIEDYPGDHGVRTWGRRNLGALLGKSGLSSQRWLFPFPDYKTPSTIVSEATYSLPRVPTLVDQWTAPPIVDHADAKRPVHDDRAAHRVFLSEGLGPEVANSFLVMAGRESDNLGAFVDDDTLIWHFGGERRRDRRRMTTVSLVAGESLWVHSEAIFPDPAAAKDSWVAFHPDRDQAFTDGANMEQEILDACRRGSAGDVEELLNLWWNHISKLEKPVETPPNHTHPYLSNSSRTILGPDHLDLQPSNFIRTDGGLEFIDREWVTEPAVDADLVRLRALWYLARTLITSGAPLPWPKETTLESLVGMWVGSWTTAPETTEFQAFYRAEAALQAEVSGGLLGTLKSALEIQGQISRKNVLAGQILGGSALATDDLVAALQAAMDEARQYQSSLENQLSEAKSYTQNLENEIEDQKLRADQAENHFRTAETAISDFERQAIAFENQAIKASTHISQLERDLGEGAQHIEKVEGELTAVHEAMANLEAVVQFKETEITSLGNDLETSEISLTQTRSRLAEAEAWRRDFENHALIRLYRRLRWWLPQ